MNHFFDLPLRARMVALGGRNASAVAPTADRLGWEPWEVPAEAAGWRGRRSGRAGR